MSKLSVREAIREAEITFFLSRHCSKSICGLSGASAFLHGKFVVDWSILDWSAIVVESLIA